MGWEHRVGDDEWHEATMVAEFDDSARTQAQVSEQIPAGHVAVDLSSDGTYMTRPAGEVIGWRMVCNCYAANTTSPAKRWVSQAFWERVASPVRHNPAAFRIYTTDDDVADVECSEDVAAAAIGVWRHEHLAPLDAEDEIRQATAAVHAAADRLNQAVLRARTQRLSWARIGSAAGISAQSAHERWARLAKQADSSPAAPDGEP